MDHMENNCLPIVGILSRKFSISGRNTKVVGVYQSYIDSIESSGAQALTISLDRTLPRYMDILDGLVLPGGEHLSKTQWYDDPNQEIILRNNSTEDIEIAFIKRFIKSGKPILGICRGMQLLNCIFGGSLEQACTGHSAFKSQRISPVKNTIVHALYGQEVHGQCNHQYMVSRIPEMFQISAVSDAGGIESIENREANILGVQWHPEMNLDDLGNVDPCFTWLADRCM